MATIAELVNESHLQDLAGDEAFANGEACLDAGCVGFVTSTPRQITAVIRDGHVYNTVVRTVVGKLGWACSCGDVTRSTPCRHVVALALAVKRNPALGT